MNDKEEKNKEIEDDNFNNSETLEESLSSDGKDEEENDENKPSNDEVEDEAQEEKKTTEDNLLAEIEQLRDEKLRLLAEMENLRKRADRERVDSIRYGSFNLARDILSPDDNLTRALDAISEEEKISTTITNLINGLKMVQKEFSIILEKYGIKKIDALNKKFDHNLHQAMMEIDNGDVEEGLVIQEMQSGYTMYDRLLRPSMVGVSKKPTKDKKDKKKN